MRIQRQGTNGDATRVRPPLRLDLAYLITAWTRVVEDEHRLLWAALRTLMRFDTLPVKYIQGELRNHELPIHTHIARAEGVLKSPGEFWTALENKLKPSLNYVVTLAIDYDQVQAGPPVRLTLRRLVRSTPDDESFGRGVRTGSTVIVSTRADIRGTVRDAQGAPMVGVVVSVAERGADGYTTGQDGGFVVRDLLPGASYTLVAMQKEGKSKVLKVTIPDAVMPTGSGERVDVSRVSYDIVLEIA